MNLVSLMCLQRNYAGINDLQDFYKLDFCVDCFLNENIPFRLRANLAKVLISVHIDKDPLEEITVPVMARVWHEITNNNIAIPKSIVKINSKILRLKDFVVKYFSGMGGVMRAFKTEENIFTYQVLLISEKMVLLGFYNNDIELLELVEHLISMLDGSNDFVDLEDEQAFNLQQQNNSSGKQSTLKRDK